METQERQTGLLDLHLIGVEYSSVFLSCPLSPNPSWAQLTAQWPSWLVRTWSTLCLNCKRVIGLKGVEGHTHTAWCQSLNVPYVCLLTYWEMLGKCGILKRCYSTQTIRSTPTTSLLVRIVLPLTLHHIQGWVSLDWLLPPLLTDPSVQPSLSGDHSLSAGYSHLKGVGSSGHIVLWWQFFLTVPPSSGAAGPPLCGYWILRPLGQPDLLVAYVNAQVKMLPGKQSLSLAPTLCPGSRYFPMASTSSIAKDSAMAFRYDHKIMIKAISPCQEESSRPPYWEEALQDRGPVMRTGSPKNSARIDTGWLCLQ